MQHPKPSPEGWGCTRDCWVQAGSRCWAGAWPGGAQCRQLRTAGTRALPPGLAAPCWAPWLPPGRAAWLSPAGSGCQGRFLHRQSRGQGRPAKEGTESPRCSGAARQPVAHQEFCYWELEPCARDEATGPPVPQTLACGSVPGRGTAPPGLILTPQGCCLLQPQSHVPSLCWVMSVMALVGPRRVPALHPQLAEGPALAPGPSSLPFLQDAGCRMARPEPAQSGGLQSVSLHCRKSRGGVETLQQIALGTPRGPGTGLPLPSHSPARAQQLHGPAAPWALAASSWGRQGPACSPCPAGGIRRAEGRAGISHSKDGCSEEKGGLRDYRGKQQKAR